jgi:UDP-glucose 4-epimerase
LIFYLLDEVAMKILVTGSSGQLGSYVCESMTATHDIVGFDIRSQFHDSIGGISILGDITSREDVRKQLPGVDAVVHCAAQVSVERSIEDPIADAETNVLGTVNLLNESQLAGVSRFVYVSSAAVLGDPKRTPIDEDHPTEPMSNYGVSKLSGEKFTLAYSSLSSMETVVIRPFNFYSVRADPESPYSGVITKFVSRLKQGKAPVIEGDGLQTRDFIHARDVARMVGKLVETRSLQYDLFNCGSGESTSVLDLARTAIEASGLDLEPAFAPPRKGDIRDSLADTTRAREALGFSSKISLREGLEELLR